MKWTVLLGTWLTLLIEIIQCISVKHYLEDKRSLSPKQIKLTFSKHQGKSFAGSEPLAKRDNNNAAFTLKNEKNFYSVKLKVGTPGQDVVVLLDTGSSDLWITGSENPYCKNPNLAPQDKASNGDQTLPGGIVATKTGHLQPSGTLDCAEYGTFSRADSKTFHSNDTAFSISYGDSSYAEGTWGYDSISVGNVSLANVSVGVANRTNSSVGILGIGLSNLENTYTGVENVKQKNTHKYMNFPMVLKAQGIIEKNAYSLFLNEKEASEGSILFGAVDHSKYSGQLYTVPILNLYRQQGLQDPLQLQVTLQGLGTKDDTATNTTTTTPVPALLDTGTTLVYLPDTMLAMLAYQLDAKWDSGIRYYVSDCSNLNNRQLYFNFGGFNIASELSSYVVGRNNENRCILGLLPGGPDAAILGDLFMQHAYIVFDLDNFEVSMAQANHFDEQERLETINKHVPGAKRAPGYSHTYSASQSITRGGDIFAPAQTFSTSSSTNVKNGRTSNGAASLKSTPVLAIFSNFIYSLLM